MAFPGQGAGCPQRRELASYQLGLSGPGTRRQIASHLTTCPKCEEIASLCESQTDRLIQRLRQPVPMDPYFEEVELQQTLSLLDTVSATDSAAARPRQQTRRVARRGPRAAVATEPIPHEKKQSVGGVPVTEPAPGGLLAPSIIFALAVVIGVSVIVLHEESQPYPVQTIAKPEAIDAPSVQLPVDAISIVDDTEALDSAEWRSGSGFRRGIETGGETLERIKVTIGVASNGDDLSGPVDLDCGLKLPLRLTSGNTDDRASGNEQEAALPTRTSMTSGSILESGQTAWFEFDNNVDDGLASLGSLHVSDIRQIRFVAAGNSAWVMEGYTIEVNGRLLAANHAVNRKTLTKQPAERIRFAELAKRQSELSETIASLQALIAAGSADEYKPELKKLQDQNASVSADMDKLRPALSAPFFVEAEFRPVTTSKTTGATAGTAMGFSATSQEEPP